MIKPPREMTEEEIKAAKLEERRQQRVAAALSEQRQEAAAELDAMNAMIGILHGLPRGSQQRAIRWVADRLDNFSDPAHTFDGYSDEPPF